MKLAHSVEELVSMLREERQVLWAPRLREGYPKALPFAGEAFVRADKEYRQILTAFASAERTWDDYEEGSWGRAGDIAAEASVCDQIAWDLETDTSEACRHSTRPIRRAFVYLDISDYSKLPSTVQLLVVLALVRIAEHAAKTTGDVPEAQLCIGDGYIYVWDDPVAALRFAGNLANAIEQEVAESKAPEFHFRIGVHVGDVRWFFDPGRGPGGAWNYAGKGINGGSRVLSVIGKDRDDIVFVSSDVRQAIKNAPSNKRETLRALHNRGRLADKHGELWRVYELNHAAMHTW